MYKLGPTQGTTNMGIIYIGSFVRHFLQNLHNNTRASSLTQVSMELRESTRVSIMMAFSLELIQKHEFLLWLPNFLWNLHRTQEFPLWWHFLWNLYKHMSFNDPIFYGTYTQHKSFHYDGSFFFYDWILYGTYITQFVWLFFKIQYFPL
jgi:hypothetical protein